MEAGDNGGLHGVLRSLILDNGGPTERLAGFRTGELFGAVADQQIFLLAVFVEHHGMVFAADAGVSQRAQRYLRGLRIASRTVRIALIRSGAAISGFLFSLALIGPSMARPCYRSQLSLNACSGAAVRVRKTLTGGESGPAEQRACAWAPAGPQLDQV